jgi:DNA (cytosine-5)-methyltransferase 1
VAIDRLDLAPNVGIELDSAACRTRAAAGHHTIRADVSAYPTEALSGRVTGLVASPVCTTFSAAGKRAGVAVTDVLDASVRDAMQGVKTRAAHRREMAAMLRRSWWPGPKLTRAERSAAIWKAVRSASLVVEPARFIHACRPEWVAMEQVREVLPLWQAYAEELRRLGYSAWCGILNSADYGVPQTRMRAILIASRVRQVYRPEPTHYDPRKGDQLFGSPWVSMAEALGWGATIRPGPAVTAGGCSTGGAEPFPTRARELLEVERDAGRWVLHTNRDQQPDGTRQTADPRSAPALTAKSGGQWVLRRDRGRGMTARTRDVRDRGLTEPAPPITAGYENSGAGARLAWVREDESVRITVEEAAALQSFPPGYPWQGAKTKRFEQVGNAVPPLLAEHVLAMAAGIRRAEVAA